MSDNRDINLQSSKRQKRLLPEDSFGDWKWREGLAELMVPIIGSLYRNGINILIYGKSLVNESPVAIMKAHRFARQSDNNELSELETFPILEYISSLNLADCEIDIGEIAVKCPFFEDIKKDPSKLPAYLNKELESVIDKKSDRPEEPANIVLYGFGRIGRLVARMMTQTTGPGNYFKLRAIVIRKATDDDIFKRASLLTKDSVHGPFDGTVRVDEDNSCLVINGNPVKIIYASGPNQVSYKDYDINDPIVIDNTGIWRDEKELSVHIQSGASKVILTAPAKGKIKNIEVVVGAQDFRFIGGSFGAASGEAFIAGVQHSIEKKMPFIFFSCSGGQRMMESSIALMQMSRTTLAVNELKKRNIPYIVVLTDPTTGGVTASWAMLGDILIAEPKATIGFAGRRVIEDTVRETLPEEFQKAEYVMEHGGIDLVVERKYLNSTIGTLLNVLLKKAEAQAKNESSNVSIDQSLQSAS